MQTRGLANAEFGIRFRPSPAQDGGARTLQCRRARRSSSPISKLGIIRGRHRIPPRFPQGPPKLLINSDPGGKFLLKRRAPRQGRPLQGRPSPTRYRLLPRQQAVPPPPPHRHPSATITRCSSGATAVYEIFEYIGGQGYPPGPLEGHLRLRPHPRPLPPSCCSTSKTDFQATQREATTLAPSVEGRPATDSRPLSPARPGETDLAGPAQFLVGKLPLLRRHRRADGHRPPGRAQIVHAELAPGQHALPRQPRRRRHRLRRPPRLLPRIVDIAKRRPSSSRSSAATRDVRQVARLHRRDPLSNASSAATTRFMLLSQAEIRTIPLPHGRGP